MIGDQRLQPVHVGRNVVDKRRELLCQQGHEQNAQAGEYDDKGAEDDQGRNQSAHAMSGQPLGQRIEQISERRPDDERQKYLVQQPQQ